MRLTAGQGTQLRTTLPDIFGQDALVMLFGSSIDNWRRGGDFDVFVETRLADAHEVVRRNMDCLTRLHTTLEFEDEKIDLVFTSQVEDATLPVHQITCCEGIPL